MVKITHEKSLVDFPRPDFALEVHRAEMPGAPGGVELFIAISIYINQRKSRFFINFPL